MFLNDWPNAKGMETKIDQIIKINNNQKKIHELMTATISRKQHHDSLLKEKCVLLKNL